MAFFAWTASGVADLTDWVEDSNADDSREIILRKLMFRIENLRKSFPSGKSRVQALKNVNIDVPQGEFFSLLGPSGSGKSTVLRCIAGLERPEKGEIFIGDTCVYSSTRGVSVPSDSIRFLAVQACHSLGIVQ